MKVFLGGTCGKSKWRAKAEEMLEIEYFNPVVNDWDEDAQERERQAKDASDIHLYVITKDMRGVFSIAEAIHSAHTDGKMVIFHIVPDGFDIGQLKSLRAVSKMITSIDQRHICNEDTLVEKSLIFINALNYLETRKNIVADKKINTDDM